jgi:hypothetical protein
MCRLGSLFIGLLAGGHFGVELSEKFLPKGHDEYFNRVFLLQIDVFNKEKFGSGSRLQNN